jgi:hypothetical protein
MMDLIAKLDTGEFLAKEGKKLYLLSLANHDKRLAPIQNIDGYFRPGMIDPITDLEKRKLDKIFKLGP